MIKYYKTILSILLVFCAVGAYAQSDSSDTNNGKTDDKQSSFKAGVNYLSNNVFMGRADTVKTPTVIPNIKYTFASGVYLSATLDYIPGRKKNKLDGGSVAGGYDFEIGDNLDGGVSFTKLFYNAKSTQISSSISSTINANLNYDIAGIITPTVSVDYNFNKAGFANDVFINTGLSHDFAIKGIFGDHDLIIISPMASLNNGTQNFYDSYLQKKKAKKLLAAQKQKLSKFTLLDYELAAPVEYKAGNFILSLIPTYAVAQNTLPPAVTSRLTSRAFYVEAGVSLKF